MASPIADNRFEQAIYPQIVNGVQIFGNVIDTKDCDFIAYIASIGTAAAASTELQVYESDSATSGFGTISSSQFGVTGATTETATFGGTGNPAVPPTTADFTNYGIFIPLTGSRKRYQRVQFTGASGNIGISVLAIKGNMKEAPVDATSGGLAGRIII